ncbi:PH domain-containing protein [Dermatophilus congolensis]|uniref:PH domain-containing protein n=1 Tax=Dermatophilus congolensis TaxID=1863 RepID=UPI001AAEC545|nr:PH domain-containing protein [Dermatophilus congolensis]MBO3130616.1 PH domain-containing protein [Dermatophilus congolensis]MBO3130754.1 PH domain-containing protein [Dermatophilus congolensis]MBO3135089.1 PH domain-containing protein [Dermatophilus congolensis]MBO3137328.1 PH domain-containing protein [Dermatophilus congolensis]MBO3139570.1 PH domain-containing protein [Dermatophilus congolensis]
MGSEAQVLQRERGLRHASAFLLDDEEVVLATNMHWVNIAEPVATVVLSLLVCVWFNATNSSSAGDLLWWAWFAVLARWAWRWFEWRRQWFICTDQRLLLITGIWVRSVAMMPLGKVTDIKYNRSVLGRLLGFGDFRFETPGQDQAFDHVHPLPQPDDLYRKIIRQSMGDGSGKKNRSSQVSGEGVPAAEGGGDDGPAFEIGYEDVTPMPPIVPPTQPITEPFEVPSQWRRVPREDDVPAGSRRAHPDVPVVSDPIISGESGSGVFEQIEPGEGPVLKKYGRRRKR